MTTVTEGASDKLNLAAAFARFQEHWSPKVLAEFNGMHVRIVKIQGAFVWHSHEHEDELFFVVKGGFTMRFRDRDVPLGEGELIVVPRGVEHCPVAEQECWVMLVEPAGTLNTGNAASDPRTVAEPERLGG